MEARGKLVRSEKGFHRERTFQHFRLDHTLVPALRPLPVDDVARIVVLSLSSRIVSGGYSGVWWTKAIQFSTDSSTFQHSLLFPHHLSLQPNLLQLPSASSPLCAHSLTCRLLVFDGNPKEVLHSTTFFPLLRSLPLLSFFSLSHISHIHKEER